MKSLRLGGALIVAGLLAALGQLGEACTGIRLKTKDGAEITGRTLEFGADLMSEGIIIPRQKEYTGTAPEDKPGLKWTTKYAATGMNALKLPHLIDGVNEKGLGVGLFYFPGYAKYQDVPADSAAKALAPWELCTYLLTTTANVDEAVKAAKNVLVGPVVFAAWKFIPPAHYRLHDVSGRSVVLEYVDGKLNIHENPLAVMTNAPTFDWHMTNLGNYVNMQVNSVPALELGKVKIAPLGQGSGMLGLPGDFTSPSRFVRAVAFSQAAEPAAQAADGVKQVFHILNLFDIPKGSSREKSEGREVSEITQWTSVMDLSNRRYYFRTFDNSRLRVIDLAKCDGNAPNVKWISTSDKEEFEDVGSKAK